MPKAPTLHKITTEALTSAVLLPQDRAAVDLALRYATVIDGDPEALETVGPKLLAVLVALGMTPSGRGAKGAKTDAPPAVNPLDELAKRRAERTG